MAYDNEKEFPVPVGSESTRRKSAEFLPKYFRTSANQKFLNATLDQMISSGTLEKISAYYGRKNTQSYKADDYYVFLDGESNLVQNIVGIATESQHAHIIGGEDNTIDGKHAYIINGKSLITIVFFLFAIFPALIMLLIQFLLSVPIFNTNEEEIETISSISSIAWAITGDPPIASKAFKNSFNI